MSCGMIQPYAYLKNFAPKVVNLFQAEDDDLMFQGLKRHIAEVRRCFDYPGIPYHDANVEDESKRFNRYCWHNLPVLTEIHHSEWLKDKLSDCISIELKPSYSFLSLYGPEGVCPLHTDRPQCQVTIDLCVDLDDLWPIYVNDNEYNLKPGEALIYSGTHHPHYRKPMRESTLATFCNMAFFHFVPLNYMGPLS